MRFGSFGLAALASLAVAQPAVAQESPEPLREVYACADTTDEAARLACYDAAVGRLRAAEQQGDVVAVDRNQVATLERESFGFSLPSIGSLLLRDNNSDSALDRVELQVVSVLRRSDGRHHFVMDNGQTWAQVEPQSASNVEPGDHIAIRRAALGSFMLSPEHGAAHRVRRVE